jgi:hypothetical protein
MKGRRKGKPATPRKPGSGPLLAYQDLDTKSQRRVRELIRHELDQALGTGPRTPHLHRFRFQLVPLCWLAGAMAGMLAHQLHAFLLTAITAVISVVAAVAVTRHRRAGVRWHVQSAVAWAASWALAFCLVGAGPWGGIWEMGWALPAAAWVERYRWKGPAAKPGGPGPVELVWRELCEEQRWHATLGPPVRLENNAGTRYPIICRGSKTPITRIISAADSVAAAYDGSLTTVIAEPREDAVKSRGWLTLLRGNTLETPRTWNGAGIDPATGLAVVGRFPEGGNAHERYYVPGIGGGTKHAITSGADGTGKTGKLDLTICISMASGICVVILDPQMGQALPAWREAARFPYACGTEECLAYLRGLYAAMMSRSEVMASLRWQHPRTRKMRRGMGFYAPEILVEIAQGSLIPLGELLPIIEIVIDEAPVLLAVKGVPELLANIAKLGRKAGFRLKIAAQVPSLAELKSPELRSILVGGGAFAYRSGDKVSGGMMNVQGKPWELPPAFPNRKPTFGLCYASTIEGRSSVPMRTDYVDEEQLYEYAESGPCREFDGDVLNHLQVSLSADAARAEELAKAADDLATDQLKVLAALTGPMDLGTLIVGCDGLRPSEVARVVSSLETDGQLRRSGDMLEKV